MTRCKKRIVCRKIKNIRRGRPKKQKLDIDAEFKGEIYNWKECRYGLK